MSVPNALLKQSQGTEGLVGQKLSFNWEHKIGELKRAPLTKKLVGYTHLYLDLSRVTLEDLYEAHKQDPALKSFFDEAQRLKFAIVGAIPVDKDNLWLFLGPKGSNFARYACLYNLTIGKVQNSADTYEFPYYGLEFAFPSINNVPNTGSFYPKTLVGYSRRQNRFCIFNMKSHSSNSEIRHFILPSYEMPWESVISRSQLAKVDSVGAARDLYASAKRYHCFTGTYLDENSVLIRGRLSDSLDMNDRTINDYYYNDFLMAQHTGIEIDDSENWIEKGNKTFQSFVNVARSEILIIREKPSKRIYTSCGWRNPEFRYEGFYFDLWKYDAELNLTLVRSDYADLYGLQNRGRWYTKGFTSGGVDIASGKWENPNTISLPFGNSKLDVDIDAFRTKSGSYLSIPEPNTDSVVTDRYRYSPLFQGSADPTGYYLSDSFRLSQVQKLSDSGLFSLKTDDGIMVVGGFDGILVPSGFKK